MNRDMIPVWIFRGGILFLIIHFYQKQDRVDFLTKSREPQAYEVIEKSCRASRGGSHITVLVGTKEYRIEYYGEKCFTAEIGGNVMLYFDSEENFLFVPGSSIYQRYIHGLLGLFLLTFVPWSRIHGSINKARKRSRKKEGKKKEKKKLS